MVEISKVIMPHWTINYTTKDCTTSCNRVTAKDVASSKLGSHHFTVKDSVKNTKMEEMFQRMYKQDFSDQKLRFQIAY